MCMFLIIHIEKEAEVKYQNKINITIIKKE